ncbi:calcium-transporting ATPase 1, endoplasmic reticulum-type-like isoform X3 [Camellia sinensis]|uniref:calcium-transporting ATPase 1, endoplasmic reticulum-type-like isoform X3 n=1 Tax=Camellia sinensis TaxID=4442 RepID=UPI001036975A|nr:calcium-transporting ATPase 1, endoplasmic reticulum-type-like isoform X3 [Camellia sinensis]
MHDELIHCKVMVEKMGLPDGLDSGTSKGYGDVLRCCRTWSKIERRIATLEFDRDRKSMGVIVSSSSRRKSLLVKVHTPPFPSLTLLSFSHVEFYSF